MQSDRQQNRAVEEERDGTGCRAEGGGPTRQEGDKGKPVQTKPDSRPSDFITDPDGVGHVCDLLYCQGWCPVQWGSPWEDVLDTGTRADPDPKLAKGFSQQPCVQHWGS